ncbi:DMT family transporter [Arsukibacterium indicum]|uniref:DMT family transporter n=1 Tax=Arsukibacterium indicum TaxID=2848612 RepID=A0ABS6MMA9_9GAMM|nr:DMT family transporter [Arsukibacterium indicum]MBV2129951.1 DMT family transporter [Arsukibacterium indicum]
MAVASIIRLLCLAAIWGASFLFMRVAVADFGPAWLMFGRVLLASVFLAAVALVYKRSLPVRQYAGHFMLLSFFNTALPFLLFAYAAQTLTASLLAVLNATAPLWGAIIGVLFFRQTMTLKVMLGLILGISGVAILVGFDDVVADRAALPAIAAAAGAACCYGIATWYTRLARPVPAFSNAHGNMWGATLWLVPLLWFIPVPVTEPATQSFLAVLALGILCTGVAYLLYFRLVQDLGATPTLTVTFLIPVFGVIWGHLFLQETIGWHTLAGAGIVIAGTMLVTGFSVSALRRAPALKEQQ